MKTLMQNIIFISFFAAPLFFACNKPAKDAKEKAQQAQQEVEDARVIAEDAILAEEKAAFKADKLEKIARNEERIAELKQKQNETGKTMDKIIQKRIDELAKRNADLKEKLNNYQDSDNAKWEEFKREFNHDMDELGKAFGELNKDNVK
jgi:uncharacterized protein YicC (UPF0701 family)